MIGLEPADDLSEALVLKLLDGERVSARSVVIASGAQYRRLEVENLGAFEATSVHYWASPLEAKLCAGQEVTVVGGAPLLNTESTEVGHVITEVSIEQLPLNGRNVLQLATLSAGVSPAQTASTGTPAQVGNRNLFITVDGGRASSTNYVMDGVYVRSLRFNNLSIQPSVDTIQEFNLLRSTFFPIYLPVWDGIEVFSATPSVESRASSIHVTARIVFDAQPRRAPDEIAR